jgi:hypothetical protein
VFERIPGLVCWKCGASLERLTLPLRRLEACTACGAELHACRLCEFFDRSVAKSCREPVAEEVRDKEHANFCDYFRPRAGAWQAASDEAAAAQADLEALFGGGPQAPTADAAQQGLEELFGEAPARKPRQ